MEHLPPVRTPELLRPPAASSATHGYAEAPQAEALGRISGRARRREPVHGILPAPVNQLELAEARMVCLVNK